MSARLDSKELFGPMNVPSLSDGFLRDVVDRAERKRVVEDVPHEFNHAAIRAVTSEEQDQHNDLYRLPSDRKPEEDLVLVRRGTGPKRVLERLPSLGGLGGNKLPADVRLVGQIGDGR